MTPCNPVDRLHCRILLDSTFIYSFKPHQATLSVVWCTKQRDCIVGRLPEDWSRSISHPNSRRTPFLLSSLDESSRTRDSALCSPSLILRGCLDVERTSHRGIEYGVMADANWLAQGSPLAIGGHGAPSIPSNFGVVCAPHLFLRSLSSKGKLMGRSMGPSRLVHMWVRSELVPWW